MNEDKWLRSILEGSSADFSKIKNDPPYPLVWDKDFNFIGHKVFDQNQPERLSEKTSKEDAIV